MKSRNWLAALLLTMFVSGCSSGSGRIAVPDDPRTASWPGETIRRHEEGELETLHVTNISAFLPGPAGVVVRVPKGCKATAISVFGGATSTKSDHKFPEMITTPSGGRATVEYGVIPKDQISDLLSNLNEIVNKAPDGSVQVVARPWIGFYRDGIVRPDVAELNDQKGDWSNRQYVLYGFEGMLIVSAQWSSGDSKAQSEAIATAEAIIQTVTPDAEAKKVEFFPGAGEEANEPIPQGTEVAMLDGTIIEATTPKGTIKIEAGPMRKRSYTWEGATRSVIMYPRNGERWYGSMGLYYPGPGNHWEEHNGISRGVVEEGQQHFKSVSEAMKWLKERAWMPFVYNNQGLVVGWDKVLDRQQLNVEVWQLMINGKIPKSLPGATDNKIKILKKAS
jgi:hypothetical protein